MLNIHLIRTIYPHWSQYSGIHQFIKYLDSQHYYLEDWRASDSDDDFPIKSIAVRSGLRTLLQLRGMKWYKLSDFYAEWKAFQKVRRYSVDIIHYLDGEHSARFLPLLKKYSQRTRPKMIATYHQPPELLDSLVIKKVIPHLDAITVVSPQQVAYFSKLTAPNKIHTILHGIDTKYYKPGNFSRNSESFKCLTVGRYLRDFHALKRIAKCLHSSNKIEFHVVSSVATEVEDLANVKVYRGIDDAQLLRLYQNSNALLLPLTQSTANNALLEGMACGLPILSTELPAVQAYITEPSAFLIAENNPDHFVDAIMKLVNHPQLCREMGEAARQRAEELDWQFIAPQYEELYTNVIGN